ncbi:f-box-like domain-containing protein [Ditylenchus destructor]|nr:f-box-like domain-containing protein [Ditylenchus destructor]
MDRPLRKPVNLPAEVWLDVFRCLRAVDVRHSCARVSRSWNKIVAENRIMLPKYHRAQAEPLWITDADEAFNLVNRWNKRKSALRNFPQRLLRIVLKFLSNLILPLVGLTYAGVSTLLTAHFLMAWQPDNEGIDTWLGALLLSLFLASLLIPLALLVESSNASSEHEVGHDHVFDDAKVCRDILYMYAGMYAPKKLLLLSLSAVWRYALDWRIPMFEQNPTYFWIAFWLIHCLDIFGIVIGVALLLCLYLCIVGLFMTWFCPVQIIHRV